MPAMITPSMAVIGVINNNGTQAGDDATIAQVVLLRLEKNPTKSPVSNAAGR